MGCHVGANRMNRDEFYAAMTPNDDLDFAVKVGAELPPSARQLLSESARVVDDAP